MDSLGCSEGSISLFFVTGIVTNGYGWNLFDTYFSFSRYIDIYHRTLWDHEAIFSRNGDNGHTLRNHVYRNLPYDYQLMTFDDLRYRCRKDFKGGATTDIYRSKFVSYSQAKNVAKDMIKDNDDKIKEFQASNSISPSNARLLMYSPSKKYLNRSWWWGDWYNAVNCNIDVLGDYYWSKTNWWSRHRKKIYLDREFLTNAIMVIKFNNRLKRWYIRTLYPAK